MFGLKFIEPLKNLFASRILHKVVYSYFLGLCFHIFVVASMGLCHICGKLLGSICALRVHVRMHTGEKPYLCRHTACGKGFMSFTARNVHEFKHSVDRALLCEICGQICAYQSRLRVHLRGHTGVKPHVCAECGYSAAQIGNLKRHVRILHP